MIDITILSPVRNEADCISEFISRVSNVMKTTKKSWELLLIDDASTDSSLKIMERRAHMDPHIRVVTHHEQKGQTGCFRTGFDQAKGKIIITMDSDLQVFPEDIPLFLNKMDAGYELVNGIRENRQHPFWIKLASRIYNTLMLILFDCPVFDAASNYTAVDSRFVKGLKLINNDHRYLIPITQRRGAKKIGEVVVRHLMRKHGKSKYKSLPKYIRGGPEVFFAWARIRRGDYSKGRL